jgi:hypothetical protein
VASPARTIKAEWRDMIRRLLVGGMIAISACTAQAEEGVMLKDTHGRDISNAIAALVTRSIM